MDSNKTPSRSEKEEIADPEQTKEPVATIVVESTPEPGVEPDPVSEAPLEGVSEPAPIPAAEPEPAVVPESAVTTETEAATAVMDDPIQIELVSVKVLKIEEDDTAELTDNVLLISFSEASYTFVQGKPSYNNIILFYPKNTSFIFVNSDMATL
mgnify:CR=1 FL=1